MSGSYYNEIDPFCAEWLKRLMLFGHIAPGEIDTRSIEDVRPDELKDFTQCHFFAGIGVWSYALRRAGWPDDVAVWTGSCPCQPFSAAGKGGGFADERHLWPAWFHLIEQRRPSVVFGEQVASKDGLAWLELVHADLEGSGYAVGAADLCAAGVGAPHIRQRLYFVGHAHQHGGGRDSRGLSGEESSAQGSLRRVADSTESTGKVGALADCGSERRERGQDSSRAAGKDSTKRCEGLSDAQRCGNALLLADAAKSGRGTQPQRTTGADGRAPSEPGRLRDAFWAECDWLPCIDGKARPVEPGTFPLAHGAPARVGRLRAYGNAIVAPLAEEFIRAYMTC